MIAKGDQLLILASCAFHRMHKETLGEICTLPPIAENQSAREEPTGTKHTSREGATNLGTAD